MPRQLEALRTRLLRSGVAPRHVRRYVDELADHLEDLSTEERAAGASPERARAHALKRLGDVDDLAAAIIRRPVFKSLSARAPVLAYVVAPSAALVLMALFAFAGLVGASGSFRSGEAQPTWLALAASVLALCINQYLPLLIGWWVAWTADQRRAPWLWPAGGMMLLALVSAAGQVSVALPRPGSPGEIDVVPSLTPEHAGASILHLGLALGLTLAPFAGVAAWRASRPLPRSPGDATWP